jgi:Ca2+-binding RTX toxin-like protein
MRARIATAWLVLLLAPAPAFGAGTVSIDPDGYVHFVAGAGDTNHLSVNATISGGQATIAFADALAAVNESETDCLKSGATVTCSGQLGGWTAKLGDAHDTATATGNLEGGIEGEDGNDSLYGSDANELQEYLNGGNDRDQLYGRGGSDFLVGEGASDYVDAGAGNDTIGDAGGEGNDSLGGGDGFDVIAYTGTSLPPAPVETFAVNLALGGGGRTNLDPETDALAGIEDVDTTGLFAPSGDDAVVGSGSSNRLETGSGADGITAGAGPDTVFAGAGDDSIDAVDGSGDRIACEHGADTVRADQFDELTECESVSVTTVAPAAADGDPPACSVTGVRRTLSRMSFFRGFTPDVDCNEPATVELRVVINVKGGVLARVGDLVLAQRTTASGRNVRLKPARRFARRLRRGRALRVRLEVDARDETGNRSVVTRRIKVKKARKERARR